MIDLFKLTFFFDYLNAGVKSVATLTSNGPIEMRTPKLGYNLMLRNIINVGGESGEFETLILYDIYIERHET